MKANLHIIFLFLLFFFFCQGEQLCRILQLQIFSSLLGLLSTVLPFHCCNGFTVFYQVLDSKYILSLSLWIYCCARSLRFEALHSSLVSPNMGYKSSSNNHSPLFFSFITGYEISLIHIILRLCSTSMQLLRKYFTRKFKLYIGFVKFL